MLFDQMSERISGLTLTRNGDPVIFLGFSFNAFNFGVELYEDLLRVNFAMLMLIVRW